MNTPKPKPHQRVRCTSVAATWLLQVFVQPHARFKEACAEPRVYKELNISRECARRRRRQKQLDTLYFNGINL